MVALLFRLKMFACVANSKSGLLFAHSRRSLSAPWPCCAIDGGLSSQMICAQDFCLVKNARWLWKKSWKSPWVTVHSLWMMVGGMEFTSLVISKCLLMAAHFQRQLLWWVNGTFGFLIATNGTIQFLPHLKWQRMKCPGRMHFQETCQWSIECRQELLLGYLMDHQNIMKCVLQIPFNFATIALSHWSITPSIARKCWVLPWKQMSLHKEMSFAWHYFPCVQRSKWVSHPAWMVTKHSEPQPLGECNFSWHCERKSSFWRVRIALNSFHFIFILWLFHLIFTGHAMASQTHWMASLAS